MTTKKSPKKTRAPAKKKRKWKPNWKPFINLDGIGMIGFHCHSNLYIHNKNSYIFVLLEKDEFDAYVAKIGFYYRVSQDSTYLTIHITFDNEGKMVVDKSSTLDYPGSPGQLTCALICKLKSVCDNLMKEHPTLNESMYRCIHTMRNLQKIYNSDDIDEELVEDTFAPEEDPYTCTTCPQNELVQIEGLDDISEADLAAYNDDIDEEIAEEPEYFQILLPVAENIDFEELSRQIQDLALTFYKDELSEEAFNEMFPPEDNEGPVDMDDLQETSEEDLPSHLL